MRNIAFGPRTLLRVTFPGEAKAVQVGDVIETGFDLLNSEVGLSSVSVTPITYRLLCTNGMRGWIQDDHVRIRHVGDVARVHVAVREAINAALEDSRKQQRLLERATGKRVASAEREFERLQQEGIRPGLLRAARRELARERGLEIDSTEDLTTALDHPATLYEIVNAFRAAARGSRFTTGRLCDEAMAHRYLLQTAA